MAQHAATLQSERFNSISVPEVQRIIVQELWDPPDHVDHVAKKSASYMDFYEEQCRYALVDRGRHLSARTVEDIVTTAKLIKDGFHHDEILRRLHTSHDTLNVSVSDKTLIGTIHLVARFLSMLKIGAPKYVFVGRDPIQWTQGSLKDCIADYFEDPKLDPHSTKLEKLFNAANLRTIGSLKVVWTDNLAEHLSLRNNDQEVVIFHHASFLKNLGTSILPADIRQETLDTYALLFPQTDKSISKCFLKWQELGPRTIDPELIKCGSLRADDRQITRFYYWRDRLVILKQVFDDAEPKTLTQWWRDRRKRVQWSTFWVAMLVLILTVFFGLIQSIEGALQVYKAYHPS